MARNERPHGAGDGASASPPASPPPCSPPGALDECATALAEAQHAVELLEYGDAFVEIGPDWRVVGMNANEERLSGKPRSEVLGRVVWEVWPEAADPAHRYVSEYRRCMSERVPVHFVDYYAPLNMWTGVTAYPTRSGGIAVFLRDVSESKRAELEVTARTAQLEAVLASRARAEASLREANERLRFHVESTPLGLVEWDSEYRVIGYSKRAEDILGYAPEEVIGKRIDQIPWVPREDWPSVRAVMDDMISGARPSNMNANRNLRKDGAMVHCEWYNSTRRDTSGRLLSVLSLILDVTDRVRAEEAVRSSEAALDAFFAGSPGILNLEDDQFRYLKTDATTPTYFGLTRETIVGKAVADLAPEFLERYGPMMRRVIETGEPALNQEVSSPLPNRPGEQAYWRASYFPVPLPGDRRGIGIMGVEITDLHKAEAALREADRRKDEFLGMLSHELRNPLAPIRNALFILDHAEASGPQARRAKEVIGRQVLHLSRIVDDLLDVTRIARGKIRLHPLDMDLGPLVRRVVEDHRGLFAERELDLVAVVPQDRIPVKGDETRLAQVLGNLLQNAAKFTPPGGKVVVALELRDGSVEMHVRDTGIGIEQPLLSTIFEPFTQVEQSLARTTPGLGLGLALVKGLVELHGGQVSAFSEGAGRGTDVTVRLPLLEPATPEQAPRERGQPHQSRRRRRVLVVDDNRDAAESMAQLLELLGHDVRVAYDGEAGLAMARAHPPDLILCDIGLPGMDGYAVAREVRHGGPAGVRLVAVSGYARPEDVERATQAGFEAHLAKPPDPDAIQIMLE